jgi:hypothetical protein
VVSQLPAAGATGQLLAVVVVRGVGVWRGGGVWRAGSTGGRGGGGAGDAHARIACHLAGCCCWWCDLACAAAVSLAGSSANRVCCGQLQPGAAGSPGYMGGGMGSLSISWSCWLQGNMSRSMTVSWISITARSDISFWPRPPGCR